jgi:arylsulfatase A-like enzyme
MTPSWLDHVGLRQTAAQPGRSVRLVLEVIGELQALDGALCEYTTNENTYHSKWLRTERFKYVITSSADAPTFISLYDLEQDPHETTNVAGDPAYRKDVTCHAELLLRRLTLTERNAWNSGGSRKTPVELDQFGLPVSPAPIMTGVAVPEAAR